MSAVICAFPSVGPLLVKALLSFILKDLAFSVVSFIVLAMSVKSMLVSSAPASWNVCSSRIIPSVMHVSLFDDDVLARVELMTEQMRQSIIIVRT